MGFFVRGVKKWHGMFCPRMFCPAPEDFSRICANKNYKLLHAYVQCVYIVSAKYQIAPSKAVVGDDRP